MRAAETASEAAETAPEVMRAAETAPEAVKAPKTASTIEVKEALCASIWTEDENQRGDKKSNEGPALPKYAFHNIVLPRRPLLLRQHQLNGSR
jgi:hypothetical protein